MLVILDFYIETGINPKKCRGQGYDGTPNIKSEKKGLTGFISKELKNALVMHHIMHI